MYLGKVHIFWEGHKILRKLHDRFVLCVCSASQIYRIYLADHLTLFKPGGEDYAPHTTASPPGFKKLLHLWNGVGNWVQDKNLKYVLTWSHSSEVLSLQVDTWV